MGSFVQKQQKKQLKTVKNRKKWALSRKTASDRSINW
jgi:hypothetical protein